MSGRTILRVAMGLVPCVLLASFGTAGAQTAKTANQPAPAPPAAKQPAPTAGQQPAVGADDAAQKAAILNSAQWRRAMFEFKEWLSAQPFYTPEQVAQIKSRFNQRVAKMTAQEVGYMLADMEEKFAIIDTPQAQEARAWMGQYLSVMSDKKRTEVLKDMPNLATMTAAQLNQHLQAVEQKRADIEQRQAVFGKTQESLVSQQLAEDKMARREYVQERDRQGSSTSPYRPNTDVNRRLNSGREGGGMGYYINPWGRVGVTFGPSSW